MSQLQASTKAQPNGSQTRAQRRHRVALLNERDFRCEQLAALDAIPAAEQREDVMRVLRSNSLEVLNQIEGALLRLENGEFGRCLRCSRLIPDGRLEVLPMAPLCMSCQYMKETGPGRMGPQA